MSDDLVPFWVHVRRDLHAQVVVVHGELDLETAPHLQTRLEALCDSGVGDVWVDLADVGYIDSTGLRALLAAYERLAASGRHLSVQNPSGQVVRLFEICGVSHLNGVGQLKGDGHRPATTRSKESKETLPSVIEAEAG